MILFIIKSLKYIQFNLFEKQDAQTLHCSPDTNFSYDYANSLNSLLSPIAQHCGFFLAKVNLLYSRIIRTKLGKY